MPGDSRSPEKDNEWMSARTKERDLLIEWLEGFKAKYQEYDEATKTIEECETTLESYRTITDPYRIPLLIKNAIHARKAQGSCLEYGLEFHLTRFVAAVCTKLSVILVELLIQLCCSWKKVFQEIQDSQTEIMNGFKRE